LHSCKKGPLLFALSSCHLRWNILDRAIAQIMSIEGVVSIILRNLNLENQIYIIIASMVSSKHVCRSAS
jgi:hypothetical protein